MASSPEFGEYASFSEIDGSHPFKQALPHGHVDYGARRLRGSEVVYFNFSLAREMGLIRRNHPDRLNTRLARAILDAFSLTIINEYDQQRSTRFPGRDVLDRSYMATRYLQLQHSDRLGRTSGDGRSVWNGTFSRRGVNWDISSCGTGVTRLCPATAELKRFYKTGSRASDYGCGTASLADGLAAALMSEAFHRNGIGTERVLAVIGLANGFAINVRAGRNLLRPSHFFIYSKQNDLESLRSAVDLFLERQVANGDAPRMRDAARRYRYLAEETARRFGRIAATFEREYIFCWLDWDGDNILADGGIIDYGSVRQFGLFHREYRFDDGPRLSTTITEQRRKARLIVQNFAQIRDYLIEGRKRPLGDYSRDEILTLFDREFESVRDRLLLRNVGFDDDLQQQLLDRAPRLVKQFARAHAYFEHARSARGPHSAEDGITWNAVFSTRDLLRELPSRLLERDEPVPPAEFMELALSTYATRRDRRLMPYHKRMAFRFQRDYMALVEKAARWSGRTVPELLTEIAQRSARINRFDRITGDSSAYAAQRLVRARRRLSPDAFHEVIRRFLDHQDRAPERGPARATSLSHPDAKQLLDDLLELAEECRHSL
jgi:uncharacterized protein YdiU (UPF0061 family)